jgi:hypothetical protein
MSVLFKRNWYIILLNYNQMLLEGCSCPDSRQQLMSKIIDLEIKLSA